MLWRVSASDFRDCFPVIARSVIVVKINHVMGKMLGINLEFKRCIENAFTINSNLIVVKIIS
jgi:hypothetical protein